MFFRLQESSLRWITDRHIGDLKPLLLLFFVGLREVSVKITRFGLLTDGGTTSFRGLVPVGLTLDLEIFPPEAEMGLHSQEALTDHDIASDVRNGVRAEVMDLEAVEMQ